MKSVLDRFKLPWARRTVPKDTTEEDVHKWALDCFENVSGQMLLMYLIEYFQLDEQMGCKDEREMIYETGKQDALKFILSLISPTEK